MLTWEGTEKMATEKWMEDAAKMFVSPGTPPSMAEHLRKQYAGWIAGHYAARERDVQALVKAARDMDSPTSWWDAELRVCEFCNSTKFTSDGLLVHSDHCEIIKLRKALAPFREKQV